MLARCCNQVVAFGRRSEALQSVVYGEGRARWMFQWVAASLPLLSLEKKGERQIGAVRWFDEYSDLGDDPTVTRDEMAREDQRLRSSYIWRSPVRKNVFDEILKHRHAFQHVDEPAVFGDSLLQASQTSTGAACWVKVDADGTKTTIASAEHSDMGDTFHQIIELRLNKQQDKVAIMLNDGRQPDAFTAVLRPLGVTVHCSGVMTSPSNSNGSTESTHGHADTVFEELEGVHTLQWLADGQHVVYSRVGALGAPTEAWLHQVGTPESMDRQLYDEEEEGFSVHVGATRDSKYLTITAASKKCTEVHVMDADCAESAPVLVHRRTPGLMYWVCHAHDRLIILHSADPESDAGQEYVISTAPVPRGGSECPSASSEASEDDGKAWVPLVTRPRPELASIYPMAIEDFVAYSSHLVLSCREGGLPVLRAVPWSEFGIPPSTPVTNMTPEDSVSDTTETEAEPQEAFEDDKERAEKAWRSVRSIPQDAVPELPTPAWAMHVVSGANLSFDAEVHVCHASSPSHPEQELRFHLPTGELLPPKPLSMEVMERVKGVKSRRLHVPVAAAPREREYLEMIMSLPRRCPTSGAVLSTDNTSTSSKVPGMEQLFAEAQADEGGDGDDERAAEARLDVAAASSGVKMPLTVVWRGDLDPGRPRPVVLRAYGAYGLCADVSFQPDDLPLLDRGIVIVTAHVRGGGELGREWHAAATVHRKWSTLYDYASTLRYLFDSNITAPGLVALEGFSAGALPAAHVLNKAPEALAAALLRRPFVTLLNTMSDPTLPLTVSEYDEWGDPSAEGIPELWAAISPHKAITHSTVPPVLVTSGLWDTRVEWWAPVKFAWRMREHQQGPGDVWLLWDDGGHFYDDPNQIALEKTFLLEHLVDCKEPDVMQPNSSETSQGHAATAA